MPEAVSALLLAFLASWRSWTGWLWTRGFSRPAAADSGRVTLILPYAPPGDLLPLLRALEAQSLRPHRLVLAVACEGDLPPLPALGFPVDIAVAGPAANRGQKSQNLATGLSLLDGTEQAVVFLDADIRPEPWWLGTLAAPVLRGDCDLSGGYRWTIPADNGAAAQAIAWLDRGWALFPKLPGMRLAWGGSLAFAPRHAPLVAAALAHGVSDDLMIARSAHEAGLRTTIRNTVLSPSPLASAGALGFWTRQLRILRLYNPAIWRLQFTAAHLGLLLWVALAASGLWLAFGALVLALLLRAAMQDMAARRIGARDRPSTRLWQVLLALVPLAEVVGLLCLWRSAFGREIRWRGIAYRIAPDGGAQVVMQREPPPSASPRT
ncbi:glycosyltransferase [Roseococcus sp. YIM B11640]|uniref:glycosyltransferase n=1 Tax=Roseococcus sp. YIM B11640 TaxID=3133973 RepID=UPI003C7B402C